MAVFKSVSVEEIIARVIRRTRLTDQSFLEDFLEWIPEAMDGLKTRYTLRGRFADIEIVGHTGTLPCGLQDLVGVWYDGKRLRYGSADQLSVTGSPVSLKKQADIVNQTLFKTDVTDETHINQADYNLLRGLDLKAVGEGEFSKNYYFIELDHIKTSFEKGTVRIFYSSMPVTPEGYPLIPDQEDYKWAMEWYLYAQMAAVGYEHNVKEWTFGYCMFKYEERKDEALRAIRKKTPDQLETLQNQQVRLIPPTGYWERFNLNTEQPF